MARNAQASGHLATRGRVCGVRCAVKVFPVLERRWTPVPTDLPKYTATVSGYSSAGLLITDNR